MFIYSLIRIFAGMEDEVMERELDLAVSCYGKVRPLSYDMVLLPWGATEPHNLHLPYLTDCILSHDIAVDVARKALQQYGLRCMVMPYVTAGSQNPGQRELPFCIHYRNETQKAILTDIVSSLYAQGVRRMLIINGHGGNTFKSMIRDLSIDYPDFIIACSEWYAFVPKSGFFDEPGDHADEVETSVMMHYHPELVDIAEAGSGASREFASQMLREKVAWVPRHWQQVSSDTGIGNPRKATAEKGARYVGAVVECYAQLVCELVEGITYV